MSGPSGETMNKRRNAIFNFLIDRLSECEKQFMSIDALSVYWWCVGWSICIVNSLQQYYGLAAFRRLLPLGSV